MRNWGSGWRRKWGDGIWRAGFTDPRCTQLEPRHGLHHRIRARPKRNPVRGLRTCPCIEVRPGSIGPGHFNDSGIKLANRDLEGSESGEVR